jgi:RNA polymerase sigma-70 factor (ECF subfamily)
MMPARSSPVTAVEADCSLTRAQSGDSAAFEALVREHQGMVFSLAYHYFVGDTAAAEDVAQDVFFELFRRLSQIESSAHLTFWLRRVTTHRCIDRYRRRNAEVRTVAVLTECGTSGDSRDILLEERIRHLVAELPPKARAVMLLRYQEDLDPSEIAHVLDMPLNTVKSHLRRSVDVMRMKLSGKERV